MDGRRADPVRPDGVIFDVDGVLIDVRPSFRAAVARTVQWLFTAEGRLRDTGPLVDERVMTAFKSVGGYNNDQDLAYALTVWYASTLDTGIGDTAALRAAAGDPRSAAERLRGRRIDVRRGPSFDEVRALMFEFYWGSEEAARRFGIAPRVDNARPLRHAETVLLRAATVDGLRALGVGHFGVITGRSREEWEAVQPRVPLPADTAVMTDEDGRKPEPAMLARLVVRLGISRPCYVGDIADDWKLVRAYNVTTDRPSDPVLGVLVCDPEAERHLRETGATYFLRHINELPSLIAQL